MPTSREILVEGALISDNGRYRLQLKRTGALGPLRRLSHRGREVPYRTNQFQLCRCNDEMGWGKGEGK